MSKKDTPIIKCPICGYEYLPAEIFFADEFLGDPGEIIRPMGKEIDCYLGDGMKLAEDFVCDLDSVFIDSGNSEVYKNTDANVVLRTFGQGKTDFVCVYSPWFDFSTEKGSYFYNGNWERIDNIFSFGSLKISEFMVESDGKLVKEDGSPFKYSIYNGEGYSDHFPLVCNLLL